MSNKYFYVTYEKERLDTIELGEKIKNDGWIDPDTVIVNCSPDYSSIVSQIINHRLSHLNGNELFEQIPLEMPYPVSNQIWDRESNEFQLYDKYISNWVNKYIAKDLKYLFIDSGTIRGRNFQKLYNLISSKIDSENYRFASLYVHEDSIFTPSYFVQKFSDGLVFEWENMDNPNWNY